MNRRHFLTTAAVFTLLGGQTNAQARISFPNGEVVGGALHWSNGGGDPLRSQFRADYYRAALAHSRLNLPLALQEVIRGRIMTVEPEIFDLRTYNNQVLPGVMMSGDGWLAINPVVQTNRWGRRDYLARSWFVTWRNTNGHTERWQVIIADVCGNLILIPRGGALPCVCRPDLDICSL
jgi:hypothetical protein